MRRPPPTLASVLLFVLLASACGPDREQAGSDRPARRDAPTATTIAGRHTVIERIVDGDTIVVDGNESVRLIGIDTPETRDPRRPVQCFGAEATRHITQLLPPGTPVTLVRDVSSTDRFGRALAYVYRESDGLFVNARMVRNGFAAAATFPPDVAHADEFVRLEREAREADRGLWSACGGLGVPVRT